MKKFPNDSIQIMGLSIQNEQAQILEEPSSPTSQVKQVALESDYTTIKHQLAVISKKALGLSKYKLKYLELRQQTDPLTQENKSLKAQLAKMKAKLQQKSQQYKNFQLQQSQYSASLNQFQSNQVKLKQQIRNLNQKVLQQRKQMNLILEEYNKQKEKNLEYQEQLLLYQMKEEQSCKK